MAEQEDQTPQTEDRCVGELCLGLMCLCWMIKSVLKLGAMSQGKNCRLFWGGMCDIFHCPPGWCERHFIPIK